MNTYKIFDIVINSDIELPILPASESSEYDLKLSVVSRSPISKDFNVYHRINFSGKPWVSFLKSSDAFAIRFHNFADFKISSDGSDIYAYKRSKTAINTFTHFFADHVIPNIMTLSDNMVFHSSTVKIGDSAVSFQAPSGTGKSTLAAYFNIKNHELLSDDSLLVRKIGSKYMAVPCYPGIRLWPESIEQLFEMSSDMNNVSQYNSKKILDKSSACIIAEKDPVELKSIYFINISDSTGIEKLMPSDAFSLVLKNLYRLDFKDRKRNKFEFRFLTEMLESVELYRLNYMHNSNSLNDVYDIVSKNSLN